MRTETSILLPSAKVHLFLKDRETIDAARTLQDDWRFARVDVQVYEGDVETAIKTYAQSASPEILMVETDVTDDGFIGRLGELSGNCNENTSAVIIGPVNDVNLYRKLTAMGVSDYLVRPVPVDTLSDVIAAGLIEKLGATGSRLIAVIGAKGGVGTSALSQALSWGSSESLQQKTLLLDAAGAWSSLGVGMGFEPVGSTAEAIKAVVAKDADSLKRLLCQINDKLFVLGTGMEPMLDVPPQITQFEEILNTVMASYPVVIVDLSGAGPVLKKSILTRAHEVIVVSTPTLSALRSARALMLEIKKIHGGGDENIDLVINMLGMAPGKEVPKSDIKAALDCDPSVVINFEPKLFIGTESEGRKISSEKAGMYITKDLLPLIQKVTQKDSPASSESQSSDAGILASLLGRSKNKK